jgi:hypothetical protein
MPVLVDEKVLRTPDTWSNLQGIISWYFNSYESCYKLFYCCPSLEPEPSPSYSQKPAIVPYSELVDSNVHFQTLSEIPGSHDFHFSLIQFSV